MQRMIARAAVLIASMAVAVCAAPNSYSTPATARVFDEFGVVNHCDLLARLDNFAIALQQAPGSIGHIVSYGPDVDGRGSGRFWLTLLKDYLVDHRGLPERRVNTIYGGRYQILIEPKIQFWITPPGAPAPKPQKYKTDIESFKGLFNQHEVEEEYMRLVLAEEMGPGIGLATDAAFADMLNQQKKAIAYIVTYQGEAAVPGAARRVASDQLEDLKSYKLDATRIKTIFGGARKKTTVQLWILSPDDPAPARDAGAEELPRKNVNITSQHDSILAIPENERTIFNRLLEVLRAQPTLKAFVIVTLDTKPRERPHDPEVDGEVADLPKLIEKWREELTNTHKIRPDRFVVLFKTTDPEFSGNYIDIWAVPPGQPLPDPDADEQEDPSDVVQDPERRP